MRKLLLSGSYSAKSRIASVQRCINLYPENTPQEVQPPVPVTHNLTPGLILLANPASPGKGRGAYRASNGKPYVVVGSAVYYIAPGWVFTQIGTITNLSTPVGMSDNGINVLLVDGTANGWTWDLATNTFSQITDPNFLGGTVIDYMDSFLLLSQPNTPIFYSSLSNDVTFDSLYLVSKTGYPDPLQGIVAINRQILLIGQLTTEVWYDAGTPDFPFGEMPGMLIQHGCEAPYSIAKQDTSVYFLAQNEQGAGTVMKISGYTAHRISNYALEQELQDYPKTSDAIGYTYQVDGHAFYVLTFPTADKTWVYDAATDQWHEWSWMDPATGALHRHRVSFGIYAYGISVGIDWETGALYKLDPNTYTDVGNPIRRVRMFPHTTSDGKRIFYRRFIADIEVGNDTDPSDYPVLDLSWSDDRGASFGNPISSSLGKTGNYIKSVQYQRLGMSWDRVFKLAWTANAETSLNGAWIEVEKAAT